MFEKVIDGIIWIPGKDKFLPDSHVYLIGEAESDDVSIVECGLMGMAEYKLEEMDKAGIPRKSVKRIIMTHTHMDHVGCLPDIMRELPHAEVWMHNDEALPLERGDSRIVFGNSMFENMIRAQYSIENDYFEMNIHKKLQGGEDLNLGGFNFQVIHIPGHSCGSIGLYCQDHKIFISGDTIYADGAIGRYDLHSANGPEMKNSLDKIAQLDIEILLPSHNRIVRRDANPMIKNTVVQWGPLLGN